MYEFPVTCPGRLRPGKIVLNRYLSSLERVVIRDQGEEPVGAIERRHILDPTEG